MTSTSITVQRRIAAGQEPVWEALTDLGDVERVHSGVTGVELLTDGVFGVGTRWRETRRVFGREATEELRVTVSEPPERCVVEAGSRGRRYVSEWVLLADGPSATTVRMTFTGTTSARGVSALRARLLGGVGARVVRRALAKDLAEVARAVEAGGV